MPSFQVGQRVIARHPNRIFPTLPGHYGHVLKIEPDPFGPVRDHPTDLVWVDVIGKVGGNLDLCFTSQWNGERGWPFWDTDLEAVD